MPLFQDTSGSFDALYAAFSWEVPEYFNMAAEVCDRHAHLSDSVALYQENEAGDKASFSFAEVYRMANQLAHVLQDLGVQRGDRVAIVLSQRIETALTHVAAHKLGAVSLPLSVLFGPDALLYRLQDSGARVLVTTAEIAAKVELLRAQLPQLEQVLVCDNAAAAPDGAVDFWNALKQAPTDFNTVQTRAEDAALLIYTSGTTGPPKGALIAHRGLLGNLPGFELSLNFFPQPDDVFYTPADWAWTGGLLDGLLPSWYYAKPIVGFECGKFDPVRVLQLLQDYKVTTGFFPPTALKMLRAVADIPQRFDLHLRAMMSAGETVGEELYHWARETFGIEINEMCGQTEHNYMIGNCSAIMPVRPGSMGKAYPGHRVEVMDEDGQLLAPGKHGEFVAHRDDAVHFLGYWQRPEATAAKYSGDWFRTGDVGYRDEDGYLWFTGRADDVISSAGYRIGPGEIEDCLLRHPAVLQAAVIGVPDPEGLRGDIVQACLVLRPGITPSDKLRGDIQALVKRNLAAYEYPRSIVFVDELPMTTTGKIRRNVLRETAAAALKKEQ
ncbi:AMP-binding protein [Granulosicoccaceae sp. 1_MG-2023]|nr:AMP-binding protein [Granulosicoccaceae sp. 1_MG-2023]